jgi:hypothetical protein
MALNAGALGDHTDGRARRPDTAVQVDSRFDDTAPRFGLLLGPSLQGVGASHQFHCTIMCNDY